MKHIKPIPEEKLIIPEETVKKMDEICDRMYEDMRELFDKIWGVNK